MILFDKFGQHQPRNRQSERYARQRIDLSLSTLADQVGTCVHALRPRHELIAAHVFSAERLHGDDTTVPILAKGKTVTGRIWTYVRHGRAFALVIPHVSTAAMSVFLAKFAATIAPGQHVVMVLDQAGWHGAKALAVPGNITLVPLPPYCPDLNPVERIWLYLRERFFS